MNAGPFRRMRLAAVLGAVAAFAPLEYSAGEVRVSTASCTDGTCCPEPKSDCFINGIRTEESYRKQTEGSCYVQPIQPDA